MQDFRLDTVKTTVYVNIEKEHIWVTFSDGNLENHQSYSLSFEHYNKLKSYKSVSALVKYAKAHALPSPNTANEVLVSSIAVEGNPPYVAGLSSTISSNTPLKTWEQQAKQHEINQIIKKYPFIKRASDLEGVA